MLISPGSMTSCFRLSYDGDGRRILDAWRVEVRCIFSGLLLGITMIPIIRYYPL